MRVCSGSWLIPPELPAAFIDDAFSLKQRAGWVQPLGMMTAAPQGAQAGERVKQSTESLAERAREAEQAARERARELAERWKGKIRSVVRTTRHHFCRSQLM